MPNQRLRRLAGEPPHRRRQRGQETRFQENVWSAWASALLKDCRTQSQLPPNGHEHGNISHRAARGDDDGGAENSITRNEHKRKADRDRAGGGLDTGGAHLSIRHGHEEADRPGRRGDQFTAEQNQERHVSRLEPCAEKTEKFVSETDQDQRRCQCARQTRRAPPAGQDPVAWRNRQARSIAQSAARRIPKSRAAPRTSHWPADARRHSRQAVARRGTRRQ